MVIPSKTQKSPKGAPSIKQVGRWLAAAENKRYMQIKRREINPRPTTKGVRTIRFFRMPKINYSFFRISNRNSQVRWVEAMFNRSRLV